MSNSGRVRRSALAASQIDWRHLQQSGREEWLGIARQAVSGEAGAARIPLGICVCGGGGGSCQPHQCMHMA